MVLPEKKRPNQIMHTTPDGRRSSAPRLASFGPACVSSIVRHECAVKKKLVIGISGAALALIAWAFLAPLAGCSTIRKSYTSQPRSDGGVSLQIRGVKRYWMPLTPEGPFPKQSVHHDVDLIGPGKDWSYRSQEGFYYTPQEISCKNPHWDLGYAWMDKDRKHVTFNLYWASAPDRLSPADINGRYETDKGAEPGGAANRSQPVGSETNRTSEAADPGG